VLEALQEIVPAAPGQVAAPDGGRMLRGVEPGTGGPGLPGVAAGQLWRRLALLLAASHPGQLAGRLLVGPLDRPALVAEAIVGCGR